MLSGNGEHSEVVVPEGTLQIYEFIGEYLNRNTPSTHINRASSASLCYKRRWYQGKGYAGEELTPRVIVNFTLGDLTEHTVKYFILNGCVGPKKLYSEVHFGKEYGSFTIQNGKEIKLYAQEDLTAKIEGFTITAHVDGWGKRNSDGKWELIEVKSAADYGFESFKEEGPGSYLKQAFVNLQTCKAKEFGATEVRFFYLKKNTGHIWDKLYPFDEQVANEIVEDFRLSNQETEPPAPMMDVFGTVYGAQPETFRGKATGRKVIKYPCSYCPYIALCQPAFETEFKSGKPIHVVKQEVSDGRGEKRAGA